MNVFCFRAQDRKSSIVSRYDLTVHQCKRCHGWCISDWHKENCRRFIFAMSAMSSITKCPAVTVWGNVTWRNQSLSPRLLFRGDVIHPPVCLWVTVIKHSLPGCLYIWQPAALHMWCKQQLFATEERPDPAAEWDLEAKLTPNASSKSVTILYRLWNVANVAWMIINEGKYIHVCIF